MRQTEAEWRRIAPRLAAASHQQRHYGDTPGAVFVTPSRVHRQRG